MSRARRQQRVNSKCPKNCLLRLKCNGVISGTANFADERGGTTLAVKRGLRVLQHHVTPVGLNVMRWPNAPIEGGATGYSGGGAPFSFLTFPYFEIEMAANCWLPDGLLYIIPLYSKMWGANNKWGEWLQYRTCVAASLHCTVLFFSASEPASGKAHQVDTYLASAGQRSKALR